MQGGREGVGSSGEMTRRLPTLICATFLEDDALQHGTPGDLQPRIITARGFLHLHQLCAQLLRDCAAQRLQVS